MTTVSPLMAKLRRRQLHKKSTLAVSEALWIGAKQMPYGRMRNFIAKKAKRTEACGATAFHRLVTPNGQPSFVASSNSRACHNRFCMSCESKRAKALARDTADLLDHVWALSPGARGLMLTLTSRKRPLDQMRAMVLDHQKALKAFFAYDRIVKSTLGHFTNIETVFSEKNGYFFANTHSHSTVFVAAGALSDHRYIRQAEYVALWQRALKADYKPIVHVTTIKGRDGSSTDQNSVKSGLREAIKYCLDTEGFIDHANGHLLVNPQVAVAFALAVHRRRLTSMDRIFNDAKKRRAQLRKAEAHTHSGD